MKTSRYNIRLEGDLKQDMEQCSAKMKISTSKFIRQAIRHYIKTSKL